MLLRLKYRVGELLSEQMLQDQVQAALRRERQLYEMNEGGNGRIG